MSKKRTKVNQTLLRNFNRLIIGCAGRNGVSAYALTCQSLEKLGRINKSGCADRVFVLQNMPIILERVEASNPHRPAWTAHTTLFVENRPAPLTAAPETDAFLSSYEWRRVRMIVLKRDGAKCACCGATRQDGVRLHVDHIKPRKLFPQLALDPSNLQVLCEECNHGKGNWDMTDWRAKESTSQ